MELTPKEKAKELIRINSLIIVTQVGNYLTINEVKEIAKQCALIVVNEILKSHNNLYGVNSEKTKHYLEVKHEIENYEN